MGITAHTNSLAAKLVSNRALNISQKIQLPARGNRSSVKQLNARTKKDSLLLPRIKKLKPTIESL
jgi:hypothetical protein